MIGNFINKYECYEDISLLKYNTYKLDVKCKCLIFPKNVDELREIFFLRFVLKHDIAFIAEQLNMHESSIKRRVAKIEAILKEYYPEAKCSLDFTTPFELVVATILSAQCTDERVNKTTPSIFDKYLILCSSLK
mgnify:CR=1 FL=1